VPGCSPRPAPETENRDDPRRFRRVREESDHIEGLPLGVERWECEEPGQHVRSHEPCQDERQDAPRPGIGRPEGDGRDGADAQDRGGDERRAERGPLVEMRGSEARMDACCGRAGGDQEQAPRAGLIHRITFVHLESFVSAAARVLPVAAHRRQWGKSPVPIDTNVDMPTNVGQERENEEVVAWRREQLVHSGFPCSLAVRLAADGRYDLHALIELVEHGCSPRLALRILAPLEPEPLSARPLLPSTRAS